MKNLHIFLILVPITLFGQNEAQKILDKAVATMSK